MQEHRTTLIFVNTRRLAERAARQLSDRLGDENITAHHGSMARDRRLDAEQRLKRGELRALVATASLELGIDIGDVDLVCQIGSTRTIAAFLQRVGRSGHAVGGTPKGRLFPLSRDELCDCAALLDATARGELDRITLPSKPLDVLAQQIVAEVALQEWREDDLLALYRRATPYRTLERDEFVELTMMLADGFHTKRGRRSAHLHRDAVNGMLRGRRGAALTAVTSGGTIPDNADYTVLLEPQGQVVGTLNEDFAVESLAGDVFQLGNTSYRILRVERGTVRVEDAKGVPPGMPFWLGEAPARSAELSLSVSRLRETIAARLDAGGRDAALAWLDRRRRPHAGRRPSRSSTTSARRRRRWAACRRTTRSCWSASSTNRAACSSSCTRRSAAASTARGVWRCASASAASSTSSCRRRRPRTRSCCRCRRATAFRSTTWRAT